MRPKIYVTEHEIELLSKDTGLSRLEVIGFISALNRYARTEKQMETWIHDEQMGRHI